MEDVNETDAHEFFDQFTRHPQFAEMEAATDTSEHWWCARHWAPCPAFGANGIGMTVEMASIFLNEFAGPEATPSLLNAMLDAADKPLCCRLGDDRMYALWGQWGPAA